jgi:hypothetical protein
VKRGEIVPVELQEVRKGLYLCGEEVL